MAVAQQLHEIARPADRHGHVADRVFEDQIPADDPGDDLAERRVGISVSRARDRDHRRQLAVTKRRETAGDRRHDKGQRHRRPRRRAARKRDRCDSTQAMMKLSTGVFMIEPPAWTASPAAAVPASAKIPVPMIAPMPETGQIEGRQRALHFAIGASDSWIRSSGLLVRKRLAATRCPPVVALRCLCESAGIVAPRARGGQRFVCRVAAGVA